MVREMGEVGMWAGVLYMFILNFPPEDVTKPGKSDEEEACVNEFPTYVFFGFPFLINIYFSLSCPLGFSLPPFPFFISLTFFVLYISACCNAIDG